MSFSEKTFNHPEFGEILVVRSPRARRVSISIRPFEKVRITLPVYTGFSKAEQFIEHKRNWIHKNLQKVRMLEDNYTVFKEDTKYFTREHELKFLRYDELKPRVVLRDRQIKVKLPAHTDIESAEIQEMIRWGVQAAWRKEAKRYLPERLGELAQKHRFEFNKVIIKNNRTRWGSCSDKNNINLSLHLMRLPGHLIDYILLHELTHTVHRNHGKSFWKALDQVCGDARGLDRELRAFRIDIY